MNISAEEAIFIMFREDVRHIYSKWNEFFEQDEYDNVPTSVSNNMIRLGDIFMDMDRQLDCEMNNECTKINKHT